MSAGPDGRFLRLAEASDSWRERRFRFGDGGYEVLRRADA